jgi:phosphotransferase system IIB component
LQDNELAYQRLSEEATVCGKLVVEGLNHVDYIYGQHRNEKVYNKILQLLNNL